MTAEQKARDMLERIGVEGAQRFTAGDLVELANLIADRDAEIERLRADLKAMEGFADLWYSEWHALATRP